MLAAGNARFMADERAHPHQDVHFRHRIAAKQNPFAIFFGCADSRVAAEIIFDQGLGDLFVVRTAGHVVDPSVLGSLEFGVGVLNCPLIVVLGHDSCGAVKAAEVAVRTGEVPGGFLRDIVERVTPSVLAASRGGRTPTIEEIEREHVERTCDLISERSTLIADRIRAGALGVVGAEYDLADGEAQVVRTIGDVGARARDPARRHPRAPGQEHRGAPRAARRRRAVGAARRPALDGRRRRRRVRHRPRGARACSPSPPTRRPPTPTLRGRPAAAAPRAASRSTSTVPARPCRARSPCTAGRSRPSPAPDEAGAWFGAALGPRRPRLVHVHRPRPLNPSPRQPGRRDGLRRRLPGDPRVRGLAAPAPTSGWPRRRSNAARSRGAPLAVERFRPNLVVDGDLEPFEEDRWRAGAGRRRRRSGSSSRSTAAS